MTEIGFNPTDSQKEMISNLIKSEHETRGQAESAATLTEKLKQQKTLAEDLSDDVQRRVINLALDLYGPSGDRETAIKARKDLTTMGVDTTMIDDLSPNSRPLLGDIIENFIAQLKLKGERNGR